MGYIHTFYVRQRLFSAWVNTVTSTLTEFHHVSINGKIPDGLKKQALGHSANMETEGVYGHLKDGKLDRIAAYSDTAIIKITEKQSNCVLI
ncbi:hypothetical protein [Oscillibacter sp.]|uniref:hypothetical protein n=1 Tax=Oscillibacter sp. TaxID=1945593 RepID=UPI00289CB401|nr:hypothetical protein [Oscillibacter sp.]